MSFAEIAGEHGQQRKPGMTGLLITTEQTIWYRQPTVELSHRKTVLNDMDDIAHEMKVRPATKTGYIILSPQERDEAVAEIERLRAALHIAYPWVLRGRAPDSEIEIVRKALTRL